MTGNVQHQEGSNFTSTIQKNISLDASWYSRILLYKFNFEQMIKIDETLRDLNISLPDV